MTPAAGSLELIERLIAFPTVSCRSNLDLVAWVEELLASHGIASRRFGNREGSKANLLATVGPADRPGILLSGHSDVVPVEGQAWSSDPFSARQADGRIYGRGACDMKGFIGLVLALLPRLAAARLAMPVHIALSYDEEVGCAGVRGLVEHLAELPVKPRLALVGEPTEMRIVTAHKGIRVVRTEIRGRAAHSSLPSEGASATVAAARLVAFIDALGEELAEAQDHRFTPPFTTFNIGRLEGGSAVNIIAEHASVAWEYRPLPGIDADAVLARVREHAEQAILPRLRATAPEARIDFLLEAAAPALDGEGSEEGEAFLRRLLGANAAHAVSFATEAGLFRNIAGIPAIVCGPGSIEQAHKPDEFVSLDQLARAERMLDAVCDAAERGGF